MKGLCKLNHKHVSLDTPPSKCTPPPL